jgi:uncharacterized protein YbjQ (UPF0145 family)
MATYAGSGRMVAHNMVTTQFELDGYRVVRTFGVVRGITVRSRSIFGTIGAGLQTLVGGNITLLTNLCEKTRAEAFDLMLQHAADLGANAVVGARYDATEVMQGVTEVLVSVQISRGQGRENCTQPHLQHPCGRKGAREWAPASLREVLGKSGSKTNQETNFECSLRAGAEARSAPRIEMGHDDAEHEQSRDPLTYKKRVS